MNKKLTGIRIKKAREAKGLTLTELGHKLDPRAQSDQKSKLSKWEKGEFPLDGVEKIEKIAEILECDPQYLLGYIEHPNVTTSWIAEQIPISGNAIDLLRALKEECNGRANNDVLGDDALMTSYLTDCVIRNLAKEQMDGGFNESLIELSRRLVGALKILTEYEGVQKVGDKYAFGEEMLSAEELLKLKRNPPERYRMASWEKDMCEKAIGELFAKSITDLLKEHIHIEYLLEKLERSDDNGNV